MNAATNSSNSLQARATFLVAAILATLGLALTLASPAQGAFGFESFEADLEGPQASKAGGHADFVTDFTLNSHPGVEGPIPDADLKTFRAQLPAGFVGDPNAVSRCSRLDFLAGIAPSFENIGAGCPGSTQIGLATVLLSERSSTFTAPIYNMETSIGEPARLGFSVPTIGFPVLIGTRVRTDSDYGLTAVSDGISHVVPLVSVKATFWSDPGNPSHDPERYPQSLGDGASFCGFGGAACIEFLESIFGTQLMKSNPGLPPRPFLSNPTRCGEELTVAASAIAYGFESEPAFAQDSLTGPAGLEDCDLVPFDPGLSVESSSGVPDSPTGIEAKVTLPASDELEVPHQSHLRKAVVELPAGLSINPSAADGLQVCSDAQLGIGTLAESQCPKASRIGRVVVTSPPLPGDGKLEGYLVQRPQTASETYRVAIVAEGFGVNAKIPGVVEADPQTGQLRTVFEETPQLPFTELEVRTDGGANAPLATPSTCGAHTATATFTPWSGTPDEVRSDSFQTSGCATPRGLSPGFSAGTDSPLAGAHSPLRVRVTRADGEQELSGLQLSLPQGLAAKLAGVPYCPDATLASFPATPVAGTGQAELNSPACPAASRIGATTVGAGAGSPYYTSGGLYLAGPYKGAPLSVAAVVPAVAGPFDLGVVVVRTALHVDPRSAQVSAISDPLPTIVGGIPLRIRDVRVELDRDRFALNPTDCSQMAVEGVVLGSEGARAAVSNRFALADCAALGFKPRLKMRLFGGTERGDYQGLRAVLRARPGDANISRTVVRMPRSAFLAQDHLNNVCTRVQFAAESCPKGSIYGRAVAKSPLLDYALRGNVYLRSSDNPLPDLVADLRGPAHQPLRLEVVGKTDSVRRSLRSTFSAIPDAPVSFFRLQLFGGKKGLIQNSTNICRGKNQAVVAMRAHNGRAQRMRVPLRNSRCAKQRRAQKSR